MRRNRRYGVESIAMMTPFLSIATRVSRKVRSLPCALEVMCSERVSTHLTGRPAAFFEASAQTAICG